MDPQALDLSSMIVSISSSSATLIAAVIMAFGAVLAAIIGRRWKWGNHFALVFAVLLLGIVVVALFFSGPEDDTPGPAIRMTYPYEGAIVNLRETVQGTSEGLPSGHSIWVLVHPFDIDRYFPQAGRADVQASGDWRSRIAIGLEEEAGKRFDIFVVLADKAAGNTLAEYVTKARQDGNWPGLESLPEGATEYDRVTVTRT